MTVLEAVNLAMHEHQAGNLARAEAMYREILAKHPKEPDPLNLLGVLCFQTKRYGEAVALIGRAIDGAPATAAFQYNLGLALAGLGKWEQAAAAFRQAVTLQPEHVGAWSRLGSALYACNQPKKAEEACRQALALQPGMGDALNGLGKALHGQGRGEEAIECFRKAVVALPKYFEACNNLGQTLAECGQFEEAIQWCRRAIEIQPGLAISHFNLSLMLLRMGQWEEGWAEYEWRWRSAALGMKMPYAQPTWGGGEMTGKRILLHGEQGLGDTIQFIRYLPKVAERGGKILVAAQKEVIPLVRQMGIAEQWLVPGDVLPAFDVQCSLTSLPGIFQTRMDDVPGGAGYLKADADRAARWRGRMSGVSGRRVGLAWAGSAMNPDDRNRSLTPALLQPLAQATNAAFFSLQKGAAASETKSAPLKITDWTAELGDLAETAGLVENLDLVITADTVVAHLAGAMGKPVWILLPLVPDWRWMLGRKDTPWYRSARLFRQEKQGDWTAPVGRVAEALKAL